MEKIVLKNIKEGDKPIGFLLVTKLEEKLTKNGSAYVVFTLTDGEKEIEANLWNHSITDVTVTPESVASFEINCKIYQEKLSYEICRYMQDDSPVDITDFIKKAPMDSQKMFNEILMICDSAGAEGELPRLVHRIYEAEKDKLLYWGAAKAVHHNYYGGLLYHTLRMVRQVQRLNRCKHWFYHNVWGMLWDINKAGEQVVRYVYSAYRIVVNKKEQSFVMEPWYGGELARVYYDRPVSRANFEAPYGRKWTMSTKHYLSSGGLFRNHDFCGYCYFYPYNQEAWVEKITADKIGAWKYLIFDLRKPERRNFYERLAKVELDDMIRDFIFSYMDPIRSIDLNSTRLLDNLNLNKNTLRILKSYPTIATWQFLKEVPDITQEKFDKWTKLFGYSAREYNRFKNPMKVCGYACTQNQEDKKGFLNSYINYLDIIEEYGNELGINLKSKSVKYPSDFTEADANLTRDYQELMKKKKAEKEAFFNKNYAAMIEELKDAMCKSKDIKKFLKGTSGLLVKIPETREELIKEGNRLHNCLATYADKMAAGKTTIFFIRKIDDPDKEYFAMEYRDGEIKQLYTYHNHRDESGKVVAFADAFAAMLKESNFEPPKLAA